MRRDFSIQVHDNRLILRLTYVIILVIMIGICSASSVRTYAVRETYLYSQDDVMVIGDDVVATSSHFSYDNPR